MYARFREHVYPMHSHDAYSFGVTEAGAQEFACRGANRVSSAGMVMAMNPDDPHDGHAASTVGYEYRMLHINEHEVERLLADATGHVASLPLFAEPVVRDDDLAGAVRALHSATYEGDVLAYEESVMRLVIAMVRRYASRTIDVTRQSRVDVAKVRRRLLDDPDVTSEELANTAGCSRFALYRAFRSEYGMPPSQLRRQVQLRRARSLIADGTSLADAAIAAGFADQSHLSRWFSKIYGITPGVYRAALRVE